MTRTAGTPGRLGALTSGGRRRERPSPSAAPLLLTLLALAVTAVPYLARGPAWFSVSVLILLGWRALIALRGWRQPPLLLLFTLAALFGWGLSVATGTLLGRDGGTPLLLLLTALKSLETHARRDGRLLVLLGLFTLSANFFFTQDTATFLHAALSAALLMGALVAWAQPRRQQVAPLEALLRQPTLRRAGVLLLQALPLTAALFVLFPRPDGPLWQMPVSTGPGTTTTGLTDEVTPGSVSNLAQSDAVAMRAEFQGATPRRDQLYWRGPVLEAFDGRSWTRGPRNPEPPSDVRVQGRAFDYTLTLEPDSGRWVTPLDLPANQPGGTRIDGNLVLTAEAVGANRSRYALRSAPDARYGLAPLDGQLAYDTQLPPGVNPQARALAQGWAKLPPMGRVQAALRLLGNGSYRYTLNPPLLPGPNAVDDLLFSTRAGFCEHYAGAFAFLMRAAGVPARLVTGYLGGQPNGGYLIVREADAHAWTEVWLANQGWVRVDPTAVVSPARVQEGLAAALPADSLPAVLRGGNWLGGLALRLDRFQNLWNQWVIGYDGARQRALLTSLGLGAVGGLKYVLALIAVLLVAALPLTLALRRARQTPPDPVHVAFARLARRLHLPRGESESASAWVERAAQAHPALAAQLSALTDEYQRLRYGPSPERAEVRGFVRRAGQLRA